MSDHDESSLAKAVRGLHAWLASHMGCVTLNDLRAMERRLVAAINNAGNLPPRVRFEWAIGLARNKAPKQGNMIESTITNEQEIDAALNIKTDSGKPAKVDGKPVWSVISGSSTFTASEDGLSAVLRSADEPGDTDFLVEADANLGEGVETISDIIRLHVAGAAAKNLGASLGTPRLKS